MLVDYHCHTNFSADSNASMAEQCEAAISKGVKQIAFTEHEDYNPDDVTAFFFKHEPYLEEVAHCRERYGNQLIIRAAIEVSEPHVHPEKAGPILSKYNWDFVLGSLHWMQPNINTYFDHFLTYAGDWRQSFRNYFTEMITLAQAGDFDILSHIDYPSRYNQHVHGGAYDIREYEDIIREILRVVIARGKGIEINTSPWRKGLANPNPPAIVIRWYREMGGEILTLGSDSHAPKDVAADIDRAMAIAKDAGFTYIATFEQRKPAFLKLD
jgi:histidinol-phosphatase (PHP family)